MSTELCDAVVIAQRRRLGSEIGRNSARDISSACNNRNNKYKSPLSSKLFAKSAVVSKRHTIFTDYACTFPDNSRYTERCSETAIRVAVSIIEGDRSQETTTRGPPGKSLGQRGHWSINRWSHLGEATSAKKGRRNFAGRFAVRDYLQRDTFLSTTVALLAVPRAWELCGGS